MQNDQDPNGEYRLGLIYTVSAFLIWGVVVIFFKQMSHVPPFELIAHRSIWSLLVLAIIISIGRKWPVIWKAIKNYKLMLTLLFSSILIMSNWSLFIWAISNGYIIESSLGYFINPLLNVLIGVLIFSEKLNKAQIIAIGLATLAILIRLALAGSFPWIALTLATTFAIYGYIRKTIKIGASEGLFLELLILLLPVIGFLYFWHLNYGLSFLTIDLSTDFMLIAAGLVTAVPLLLFSAGARRIKMTTLGLLQYIAPSIQFCIGLYYGEAFTYIDAIVFGLIWTGCLVYAVSGFMQAKAE